MASFIKSKLKAAREAIGKKEYRAVQEAAAQVLEYEPNNYNAHVFLGLAYLELGEYAHSEEAYKKAAQSNPDQLLAWQGLSKFYERTERWKDYGETLRRLADLLAMQEDAMKCAETLQKYIDLQRSRGTREDVINAIALLLPNNSTLYATLSMLPEPEPTAPASTTTYGIQVAVHHSLPILEEMVALTERDEDEKIKKEVERRRMRLGAGRPEQIKKEVSREVWEKSRLPSLYDEILNHQNTTDEARRVTERKLLRHKMHYLETLPNTAVEAEKKRNSLADVETLTNGIVLLGLPDELAWMFVIDHKDVYDMEAYDFRILRRFAEIFPQSPQTRLIHGYFQYMKIPVTLEDIEGDGKLDAIDQSEDPFATILDVASQLPKCILAHRIVSEVYRMEGDHENVIKTAEAGIELIRRAEMSYGKLLARPTRAFHVVLAVSLVKLYPPKHHQRASELISSILAEDPDNIPCLMGQGYILQYANQWTEAVSCFKQVIDLQPDCDYALEAREEWAWSIAKSGKLEEGIVGLQDFLAELEAEDGREEQKARAWWRLGQALWDSGDENKEAAYKHFITSLKRSNLFAPAFTSLGIYYADVASPPDLDRSSKCFQKAFELDAREAEAARRLAEGFADEREWDLVDIVARRTIEGEGGLEGGAAGQNQPVATRYLPTNAWAWKATGVVELHRRNYPAAIQSFQIALRADGDDSLSWQRLGEAYSRSGRHAAAIKALKRALELNPDDWMSHYLLGEVYRLMGQYSSAIELFEEVRQTQPSEISVLLALAETHLAHTRTQSAEGFRSRAEVSAVEAICVAQELIKKSPGFRRLIWKVAADAAYELSKFILFDNKESVSVALTSLVGLMGDHTGSYIKDIINLPISKNQDEVNGDFALEVAIAAYDYRISLDKLNDIAGASILYDLGAALTALSTSRALDKSKSVLLETQAKTLVQKALAIDPFNDVYWNVLGNLNFVDSPKISQHAYIKALDCDAKNVTTWTNLGLLYLYHDDNELANEAFYRAQTLDPDYMLAWVGQGLVASANGHHADSHALFSHAVNISADVPAADLEFSKRAFERLASPDINDTQEELLPSFHAIGRYSKQRPNDASALHLFALICERLNLVDLALNLVVESIGLLERSYEETEDSATEEHFALANGTWGRLLLAIGEWEKAAVAFSTSLSLLPQDADDVRIRTMRALAQFGSGIAHLRQEELEKALGFFEACLTEIPPDMADMASIRGHVVVLLSQTLWALGSPEAQETAQGQLLECVSNDPENLTAVSALVAMGILNSDDALVNAALSEIQGLPLDKRRDLDPGRIVSKLLVQNHLAQGRDKEAVSEAQRTIHMYPFYSSSREALATLLLQEGKKSAASAVIEGNREILANNLDDSLRLSAIATDDVGNAVKCAQKSVFVAPWKVENWKALAYVRCTSSG